MKFVERWFWVFCVLAALVGLFVPFVGAPLGRSIRYLLGGILFFTGLRLDVAAAWREFRQFGLVAYLAAMRLVVLPPVMYMLARLVLPEPLAVGVLIVAAMPCGTACSALTDIVGGNAALALVGTVVTTLLCPLTTPAVIAFWSGESASGGAAFLLRQAGFLALVLFLPLGAALALRRVFPAPIERRRQLWAFLAMIALFLIICGAMASVHADFESMLVTAPARAALLCLFMCFFSAFLHVVGYLMAPWRPVRDRAALSVNIAYVNNGLAIVFASQFFREIPALGAAAVLPAILLEIPMDVALGPLRTFVTRRLRHSVPPVAGALAEPPGGERGR